MTADHDEGREPIPEDQVDALRSDINEALAALIRLQPHLATMETSEELERILEGFRGNETLFGSRATARDLTLAEIAFVHLSNDAGDLELATRCIEQLQRYGEELERELNDVNTLIKAQLLRVLAHLREGDSARTHDAITAFQQTVSRFRVHGDRRLVMRVKKADTDARRDVAIKAVRDRLLWLFGEDIAFLSRITARTARWLSHYFGSGQGMAE